MTDEEIDIFGRTADVDNDGHISLQDFRAINEINIDNPEELARFSSSQPHINSKISFAKYDKSSRGRLGYSISRNTSPATSPITKSKTNFF